MMLVWEVDELESLALPPKDAVIFCRQSHFLGETLSSGSLDSGQSQGIQGEKHSHS